MAKVKLEVWGYRCERCGHDWVPRNEPAPRVCPSCKSPYWDRPRKGPKKEGKEPLKGGPELLKKRKQDEDDQGEA